MRNKPAITIRLGASNDEITVNGTEFNRAELGKRGMKYLSRTVTDALKKRGYFKKRPATALAA